MSPPSEPWTVTCPQHRPEGSPHRGPLDPIQPGTTSPVVTTNARLTDDTRLTEAETLALACDAKILPGIFNKHTGNALLGRSQRKIPKWLRKQLTARDGGCIGCGAHHKICQVHHIRHWKHGGQTTLENTCLVCWPCHHVRLHQNGEQIIRHPGGRLTIAPPTKTAGGKARSHPHQPPTPTPTDPVTIPRAKNPRQMPTPRPPSSSPPVAARALTMQCRGSSLHLEILL